MFVVDASVWVSRFHQGDVNHAASREWLELAVANREELVGPTLLLAEVAGPIARLTRDSSEGSAAMGALMGFPNLAFVAVDYDLGLWSGNLAGGLKLKGADAVYLALAESRNCALVTWDKELLDRSASTSAQVVRPSDLLTAGGRS